MLGILLALTLPAAACAGSAVRQADRCGVRSRYQPPSAPMGADQATLVSAASRVAIAQGFEVVATDLARGVVVALAPVESAAGISIRNRWTYMVRDGAASVALTLEVRLEERPTSPWRHADSVCVGYAYSRERQQLERLGWVLADLARVAAR